MDNALLAEESEEGPMFGQHRKPQSRCWGANETIGTSSQAFRLGNTGRAKIRVLALLPFGGEMM